MIYVWSACLIWGTSAWCGLVFMTSLLSSLSSSRWEEILDAWRLISQFSLLSRTLRMSLSFQHRLVYKTWVTKHFPVDFIYCKCMHKSILVCISGRRFIIYFVKYTTGKKNSRPVILVLVECSEMRLMWKGMFPAQIKIRQYRVFVWKYFVSRKSLITVMLIIGNNTGD